MSSENQEANDYDSTQNNTTTKSVHIEEETSSVTATPCSTSVATTSANTVSPGETVEKGYKSHFAKTTKEFLDRQKYEGNKKDVIVLHQILEGYEIGHCSISPFCCKLECYLRFAKIPYENYSSSDMMNAPKSKMPFIEHKGKKMGDSSLIIEYLKMEYGDILDSHLTAQQRGVGVLLQRTLEEHAYFVLLYLRWCADSKKFKAYLDIILKNAPFFVRWIPSGMIQSKISNSVMAQGMGKHEPEEIYAFLKQDLDAVEAIMNPNYKFLFGEQITSYDACLYAFLNCLLYGPEIFNDSDIIQYAMSKSIFKQYVDRIKKIYFPSEKPCTSMNFDNTNTENA